MNGITEKAPIATVTRGPERTPAAPTPLRVATLAFLGVLVIACFAKPLLDLLKLSWNEELHSHIVLVPFICGYLVWIRRNDLPAPGRGSLPAGAVGLAIAGALLLAPTIFHLAEPVAILSIRIAALVILIATVVASVLGLRFARAITFPLAFLLFITPLPPVIVDVLEVASQHASAEVYSWMMELTGSTYYREGLRFALPGLNIQVAQECSGIRSSFVLLIVSLLASNLFLSTYLRRSALVAFVIPLGIIRNAFRIFTLSFLSVHWDKSVIDSALHHKGGPIFFALSLIPFSLFLLWLCKSERKKPNPKLVPNH